MAFVEKNGQPSMEEILASIRRIVADDPSGVSPLIDLDRKPLNQNDSAAGGTSAAGDVGVDDSPEFELPSMFRPENRHDLRSGQAGSKKRGGNLKSAPIGRLTDAIRNVGPKVAAVGNGGQTPQRATPLHGVPRREVSSQTTSRSSQPQDLNAQTPQSLQAQLSGASPDPSPGATRGEPAGRIETTQLENGTGDAAFGGRPKLAQSLSSLDTKGETTQRRGTTGMATSLSNANGATTPSTANGHVVSLKKANGTAADAAARVRSTSRASDGIDVGQQTDQAGQTHQADQVQPTTQTTTPLQPQSGAADKATDAATASSTPPSARSEPQSNPPRVMTPFRDMRMNMMASANGAKPGAGSAETSTSRAAAGSEPKAVAGDLTHPDRSDIGSIVPSALDLPGRGHQIQSAPNAAVDGLHDGAPQAAEPGDIAAGATPGMSAAGSAHEPPPSSNAFEADANPPPLPDAADTGAPQQIEDATADLLRPMLRQWLSDNMPRMVEKALHIEVAETVRTGKPTDAS